jgi:hypothetical protein
MTLATFTAKTEKEKECTTAVAHGADTVPLAEPSYRIIN